MFGSTQITANEIDLAVVAQGDSGIFVFGSRLGEWIFSGPPNNGHTVVYGDDEALGFEPVNGTATLTLDRHYSGPGPVPVPEPATGVLMLLSSVLIFPALKRIGRLNLHRSWTRKSVRFAASKASLALLGLVASYLVFTPSAVQASDITLQGLFTHDDDVQLFNLTVAMAGAVDIRSYGYAGGTASTGTVVPRGGFDTILTLFEGSGTFLKDNDDGAAVAADPQTGKAGDASIMFNLAAGSYIVALTQFDNFSHWESGRWIC